MKKLLFIITIVLLSGISFIACSSDDDNNVTVIDYNTLPQAAKDFLSLHFPGANANYAHQEIVPVIGTLYEVRLSNGFEVDFDANGNWVDIEGNNQIIPASILKLLPQAILDYCNSNYPNAGITEIDKEPYGYKIDLNNGIDLQFDAQGNFLGIDR